jgi:hypothetical protein
LGNPALAIPCPACGARAGERCTSRQKVRVRPHLERVNAQEATLGRLDYLNARYASGPKLARELLPLTLDEQGEVRDGLENVRRQLERGCDYRSAVRFWTVDSLCIAVGTHPARLPSSVWVRPLPNPKGGTPILPDDPSPGVEGTLVADDELSDVLADVGGDLTQLFPAGPETAA